MSNSVNSNYEATMRWFQNSVKHSDDEGSASSMTSGSFSNSANSSRSASPNLFGQLLRRESFSSDMSDTSYQGDLANIEPHRRHTRSQGNDGVMGAITGTSNSVFTWIRNLGQNVMDVPFEAKQQPAQEISTQTEQKISVESSTQTKKESGSMKILLSVAALIGTLVLAGAYFYSSQSTNHNMQLEALRSNHTSSLQGVQSSLAECTTSKVTLKEYLEQKCNATVAGLKSGHAQDLNLQAVSLNATWAGKLEQAVLNAKQSCSVQVNNARALEAEDCDKMIETFAENIVCNFTGETNEPVDFKEGIEIFRALQRERDNK